MDINDTRGETVVQGVGSDDNNTASMITETLVAYVQESDDEIPWQTKW